MAGYIPTTAHQQKEMLSEIGLKSFDELFSDIPKHVKLRRKLDLPDAMTEPEVMAHLKKLAGKNRSAEDCTCFLGAGTYDHYIPSVIKHLVSRQEFTTAYTPYQPEISQGTLQAIFEYQSMIAELTGMDVCNASVYDGATALAEASSVACAAKRRGKLLVSKSVNPLRREVVSTYARFRGSEIVSVGCKDGQTNLRELENLLGDDTAAVLIESPNFFGCIEDVAAIAEAAHQRGALLIVGCDPISLALLKPPGELGADIAVGEGQSLGNSMSFGGPGLGFFAARESLLRKIPGRIVGMTTDKNGKTGFVLTLQAREQHIRREKATSNICSNHALNALTATIYLSMLGKKGLRDVALQCTQKAHYAYAKLTQSGVFIPAFSAPFFQEFTVKYPGSLSCLNDALYQSDILGGLDAGQLDTELAGHWIVAVTEKRTRDEIDHFAEKAVNFSE